MTDMRVGEWLVDVSAPLGSGHFARVLPARRARANPAGIVERRAVKIYHARGSAAQRQSALAEIRVQEELLGCPHAVAYVDAFVAEEGEFAGCLVQVMELGDRSLADHLDVEGPLRSGDAAAALSGIATALEHVHARGWVHADLKPGNIVRCRGLWKIADFNVTSALIGTSAFDLGGTLSYMSPQRLAAPTGTRRRVRPEDDMWALGVILGQCLLGELPSTVQELREEEAVRLAAGISAALLRRADVDPQLLRLIDELTSPDAAVRPGAGVVARRLRDASATVPIGGPRRPADPVFTIASLAESHNEVFAADDRGLWHRWYVEQRWSEWVPFDHPAPAPVSALAAASPSLHREMLWLLDDEGRLWRSELAVDPESLVPKSPWSPWVREPGPGATSALIGVRAAGAPWARQRLFAVDADGGVWCRIDAGPDWRRLHDPGSGREVPAGVVAIVPCVSSAAYGLIDADGRVWLSPGPQTEHLRRPRYGPARARAMVLLPDEAMVILEAEGGVSVDAGNLYTGPIPLPPSDRAYLHIAGSARRPRHLELVLGDDRGGLWHTWAWRGDDGCWQWHPQWGRLRRSVQR
ncbi:protein kinase [Embleya sp. NPDC005971]|uniref:serine/threonine protein kinase n=1 Tax=Embleya sp. NPDC005971 TaxID=3156724 RepID=UPI0033E5B97C